MDVALAYDAWSSVYDTNVNPTRDLEAVALREMLAAAASSGNDTPSSAVACVVESAKPIAIERILEVGCGTGKNTVWFAQRPGARSVYSVDLSEKMLDKARDRLQASRNSDDSCAGEERSNITFQQADVLALKDWGALVASPSETDSAPGRADTRVDLVSFSLVLEHMEDLQGVFAKAAAVTKPGGLMYVGELHPLKQYAGSKARFDNAAGETTVVSCFNHHVSDFLDAATASGYSLLTLKEYFDGGDRGSIPRILAMLFQKRHESQQPSGMHNTHVIHADVTQDIEIEVCLSDIESAIAAQRGGATSIELCSDRAGGGVTPPIGLVQECVRRLRGSVFVNVLVRPRVGDFVYSAAEVEVMLRDVHAARLAGADGVVIGALTPSGAIDEAVMRGFREAAGGMFLTFHRAIDVSSEPIDEALAKLARLGCNRVLSSGMRRTALDGLDNLSAMVKVVNERKYSIKIVAASGVNAGNAKHIVSTTGVHGVHAGSALFITHRNPARWQSRVEPQSSSSSSSSSSPALVVTMGAATAGAAESDMDFPVVDEHLVREFAQSVL